ncbi:MAG: hypothetical protein PVG92_06705 [Holophagae bacterium]|jgi:hypothetical protein
MRRALYSLGTILLTVAGAPAQAQDTSYRTAENPYQDELDYQINDELDMGLEIDGVRWSHFAVKLRTDRERDPDRNHPVTVELQLENTGRRNANVLLIILFEDAEGDPLERLQCEPITVGAGRSRDSAQKYKLSGAVLEATRKIYLFVEVEL